MSVKHSLQIKALEHRLDTMKLNRDSVLKSIILARRLVKRMYYQVNTTKDIDILKDLLRTHQGEKALNFVIYDNEDKIKLNMPSRKQKVKISQELLDELKTNDVIFKLN